MGGNARQIGASEGRNVRFPGGTEERKNEEAKVGGGVGPGRRVGSATGAGARCGKEERATEGAGESGAGGPGAMERHRAQTDCYGGGLPRRQVRVQNESGAT